MPSSTSADNHSLGFKQLVERLLSVTPEIYHNFDIYRTEYSSANHEIGVDVLIPKHLATLTSVPLIVRIHGGFLVTGSNLFPAWFSPWILEFAAAKGAVIISPNYRLLPEANGIDVIEDLKAFWAWFRDGEPQRYLDSLGRTPLSLDTNHLLLVGESAGGYLALQSVLLHMSRPQAMILLYPMIDMHSDYYNTRFEKTIVGVPNISEDVIDAALQSFHAHKHYVTEADPPTRLDLAISIVQNGRLGEFLGSEEILYPLDLLRSGDKEIAVSKLPPLFILHGEQDTAVPVHGTVEFVERVRDIAPDVKLHIALRPGDHGFDAEASTGEPWLQVGLDFVSRAWLGQPLSSL
ncbi:hypothetical protein PFICI_09755 [Pestalotiopsis fici W106-1]|uniref:Alpha/beta hydrolase fold-3 domain-containing protein n=1 Tax=Pestalotiopsis fici (strain W106-1 / CGMCC3.15140) TaxID=1229662 RepID=W3WUZ8_PESFW|nr:uncharacterized protein PFICI_09755 [Pestalotiopsis fici W106-1]ETS77693.1 hypothetical protein PFICI_09755 [Pestalotiopsis fici W106-1]